MRSQWIGVSGHHSYTPSNYTPEQSSTQSSPGQGNSVGDSTNMDRTTVVSYAHGNVGRLPSLVTNMEENNLSSVQPRSCSPAMEDPSSSCMASFRRRMQTTGFSGMVCDILMASWRTSTKKRYEGPWRIWAGWCGERNKCPFSTPVKDILEFLTSQFQERNLAYRKIGVYKSCISQFHHLVDGQPIGNMPIISRYMKGIFELQPPKPKTSSTWSVGNVVNFLQEMGSVEILSLQDLSLKLAMLLALTSAARLHELISLECANVIMKKDS